MSTWRNAKISAKRVTKKSPRSALRSALSALRKARTDAETRREYPLTGPRPPIRCSRVFANFLTEGCRDGGESRKAGCRAREGLHVLREGRRRLEGSAKAAERPQRTSGKSRRRWVRDGHELHLLRRSGRRRRAGQTGRGRAEAKEEGGCVQ